MHAVGRPSLSINVPLQAVACTTADTCVAVGATTVNTVGTTFGQFRDRKGSWTVLDTPSATYAQLDAAACNATRCLFGGNQASGDLLWSFNALNQTLSAVSPAVDGTGVTAISCFSGGCAYADASSSGTDQVTFVADGATPSAPMPLSTSPTGPVTALSCTSLQHCLVADAGNGAALLSSTTDGGQSWSTVATPAHWTSVVALQCFVRGCDALGARGTTAVALGRWTPRHHWRTTAAPLLAAGLACTALTHCVVAGQHGSGAPALALWDGTVRDATLRYVPSPLVAVACGRTDCTAVANTTVVNLSA